MKRNFSRPRPIAMFQGWICLMVLDLERKTELWFVLYLRCGAISLAIGYAPMTHH